MPSPDLEAAIAAARQRIRGASGSAGRWMAGYAQTKIATDWVYPRLCEHLEPGATVLDLGSGLGLLGLLLGLLDRGHHTFGIEWDERKVAFARALQPPGSPAQVQQGDLLECPWPPADVVTLIDVLHYFSEPDQRRLLQRISDHLAPGGLLLVRVMNRNAGGWAWLTRWIERAAVAFGWNRAARVHWRSTEAVLAELAACGFEAGLCSSPTPLFAGNHLIKARKR